MNECSNNHTNVDSMATDPDALIEYAQACLCCGYSAIISATWDTCPDTKPSLLGADEWFAGVLTPGHWEECGPYLEKYDCAGYLGYARADAGGNTKFYHPSSMPSNGTKTFSNVGGVVSTPVSGDTFTWTFSKGEEYTVTVTSADATVTGTKTTGGSGGIGGSGGGATSSATGTAESDAKPGMGSSLTVPSWSIAGSVGVLILSTL
ncbi:unnamed protein product [Penicillium viridicatum]